MNTSIAILYLISSAFFIAGLKGLGSPATAVAGNRKAAIGMLLAIIATLVDQRVMNYEIILIGILIGSVIGVVAAKFVKMTAMPQMVAIFNGLGGGASALVGAGEYIRLIGLGSAIAMDVSMAIVLSLFIGGITFSGSLLAFSKLQGLVRGTQITFKFHQPVNLLLLITGFSLALIALSNFAAAPLFLLAVIVFLILGILFVLPIGGADMPVVISLLNSLSGVAAAVAGFIIMNHLLIIAGALVGASGLILTQIMCKAMNRSVFSVLFGSFGKKVDQASGDRAAGVERNHRSIDAEEAAMVLAYAKSVVIVPGYGMAVAQAQHSVRELSDLLEAKHVAVKFGIHPVAGRMPGHMNVLLAEANVSYGKLADMESINPEFERTDVVVVIGANDVVNPAAKTNPGSPIYGMPVLEVDKAKQVIIIKRSMNPGFAGIDNDLFYAEKSAMLFGSAKDVVEQLISEVKQL
ncbi:MAG: NAD(P) transhydrogenase subunit beta [Candidatus Omnitrophota bacterium]|jgi:NAD(P) transhydrogenase subunit beta